MSRISETTPLGRALTRARRSASARTALLGFYTLMTIGSLLVAGLAIARGGLYGWTGAALVSQALGLAAIGGLLRLQTRRRQALEGRARPVAELVGVMLADVSRRRRESLIVLGVGLGAMPVLLAVATHGAVRDGLMTQRDALQLGALAGVSMLAIGIVHGSRLVRALPRERASLTELARELEGSFGGSEPT